MRDQQQHQEKFSTGSINRIPGLGACFRFALAGTGGHA
jgi:hypothetical protein